MSDTKVTRRQMLAMGAAGAGGLLLYSGLKLGQQQLAHGGHSDLAIGQASFANAGAARIESPSVKKFVLPLALPQTRVPYRSDETGDYYEIHARTARQEILPGKMTTIFGYDGETPSKTIDVQRGRKVFLKMHNDDIAWGTSCHLHGGITAPEHDGYAEDMMWEGREFDTLIEPGKYWEYEYPNNQPMSTNWYHDHCIHHTAENVYRGLAGFYLVRDDVEAQLNLPGNRQTDDPKYEVPLVFQDKIFDSSGEFVYDHNGHEGVEGDVQLVNGVPWPVLEVKARKYRFRLLNGSTWRRYDLSLSHSLQLYQIATDSGFLKAPVGLNTVRLYGAERGDFIVDFSKLAVGTTVTMYNRNDEASDTEGMTKVMVFKVTGKAADPSSSLSQLTALMAGLVQYEDLTTKEAISKAVRTRDFRFGRTDDYYTINEKIWDKYRYDANPRLGTTEIWRLTNKSGGWFHPIHIHLINFQILDRADSNGSDRRAPHRWERGRKDTVALGEGEQVRVIIKFDAEYFNHFTGPYMMHCHNVDHEDHDMMTQFMILPQA